ncbi:MAG TPA: Bax inhibitor-1/YccA family protein [Acidimicrobiales bacterium]|nr:Bax inhibitor-1/YccA family protein [Acidimicrobiales bacterium]
MANPALNEKTFAPERFRRVDPGATDRIFGAPAGDEAWHSGPGITEPADRSGRESWRDTMTLDGVVLRGLILFPILLATGWFGWQSVERTELGVSMPGWLLPVLLVAFGVAMVTIFKPRVSPYTAPAYAALEGLVLGAISALYEARYQGIVLQAVMLTGAVFAIMLALYSKRIVKVDDRLRRGIVAATGAVFVVYLISMVMRLFGAEVPFIHEASPVGILFSLVVVGIASANLLLDFDLIEKGVENGAPKWMEWYAAFGLLVTLVWLYLELLRLLSKLRSR